jgi:transcription initiation factor IIE alpha subunit
MKKIIILAITLCIASPAIFAQSKAGKVDPDKHVSFYSCPKHPGIVSDKPGKCSTCGMNLHLSGKEKMKADVVRIYSCPIHVDAVSHDPGKCPKCGKKLHLSPKEQMKAEAAKIYTCPMHPEVALNKEGVCPKCDKALVVKKKN